MGRSQLGVRPFRAPIRARSLPRLQDPHLDVGGELGGVARELVRRVRQPAAAQADREERAPVDRHRDARSQQPQRLGGRARVQVPLARAAAPSPTPAAARRPAAPAPPSRRRRRCRPRSTRACRASITKPSDGTHGERRPRRARWCAAVAVTRTPPHRGRLPLRHLDDPLEPAVAQQASGPRRGDDRAACPPARPARTCRGGHGARARSAPRRPRRARPAPGRAGVRCPSRARSSGSVSRRAPPSSSSTVACPSHRRTSSGCSAALS